MLLQSISFLNVKKIKNYAVILLSLNRFSMFLIYIKILILLLFLIYQLL